MNADEQRSRADALRLPSRAKRSGASVTHNAGSRRFEIRVGDDSLTFLSYTCNGDQIIFEHTFVPEEFRGRGIAANLARAALEEARQRGWRVIPRCSYIAACIKHNPQFADLIATEARL